MKKLDIHSTVTAQWQKLVAEAETASDKHLTEGLESYVVFLLMRFTSRPDIAESVLSLEFLESFQAPRGAQCEKLRDVGDKCLLYSGFFPERAVKKQVSLDYFVDIGQSAYARLAELNSSSSPEIYAALCEEFLPVMSVLQEIRRFSGNTSDLQPLQIIELWQKYDLNEIESYFSNQPGSDSTFIFSSQNTCGRMH